MISEQKVFGNYFAVDGITPTRLLAFGKNAANRFRQNNPAQQFDDVLQALDDANFNLQTELTDVSGSLALQKGKTLTADQVMAAFQTTMKDEHLTLAAKLGGPKT